MSVLKCAQRPDFSLQEKPMKKLDEIVFYACLLVTLLLGFAGGVITVLGTILMFFGKV